MSDPSLATLVPTRTRARNAVLVTAGIALLVAAAYSPRVLRPTFGADGFSGAMSAAGGDRTVLVSVQATTNVWPWATITGAVAPPGTHVVGTWVETAPETSHTEIGGAFAQPSPAATWRDLVPDGDAIVNDGSAAPVRVSRGQAVAVVVVWQVDDCEALRNAPIEGDTWGTPFLRWRTIIGTTMTSGTSETNVPQGSTAKELLRDAGVCP